MSKVDFNKLAAAIDEHDASVSKAREEFEASIKPFVKAHEKAMRNLNNKLTKRQRKAKPSHDVELKAAYKAQQRAGKLALSKYEEIKKHLDKQHRSLWVKCPAELKGLYAKYNLAHHVWESLYNQQKEDERSAGTSVIMDACNETMNSYREARGDRDRKIRQDLNEQEKAAWAELMAKYEAQRTKYKKRTEDALKKYTASTARAELAIQLEQQEFEKNIKPFEKRFQRLLRKAKQKLLSSLTL